MSIFNFHYASPPTAVAENFALNKVIGDNETGFKGTGDTHYRMEAWEFLLAGGGLYNNLDYSFAVGHEDGTFKYPDKPPGGGNRGFRTADEGAQGFHPRVRLRADEAGAGRAEEPRRKTCVARCSRERGKQYAIYVKSPSAVELELELPQGNYFFDQTNAITGFTIETVNIRTRRRQREDKNARRCERSCDTAQSQIDNE